MVFSITLPMHPANSELCNITVAASKLTVLTYSTSQVTSLAVYTHSCNIKWFHCTFQYCTYILFISMILRYVKQFMIT